MKTEMSKTQQNKQMDGIDGRVDGWMDGQRDGPMDGQIHVWMDGWKMDGLENPFWTFIPCRKSQVQQSICFIKYKNLLEHIEKQSCHD